MSTLTVDSYTHRVLVDEKEIPLSRIEFLLLLALATAPGKAHKRADLLKSVWNLDPSQRIQTRTLDAHIYRLRKKIGAEWVSSVPGYGYRLEPRAGTILMLESQISTTNSAVASPHPTTFLDAVGGEQPKASVEVKQ